MFQNDLPHLKCFSLTCYGDTQGYDIVVVLLLHRMLYLEELTLYIHILGGSTFIFGIHLDQKILIHMPRLHTFTFYIASKNVIADPSIRVSSDDIQRTFTNIKYEQVGCIADHFVRYKMICRVFSLPFKFHRLEDIGNNIANIVFNSVTHLTLWDKDPFKHDFFVRLAKPFPFVQNLSIWNIQPPFWRCHESHLYNKDWGSIVEYQHLISLDIEGVNPHYVEHFLNETKTHLPRLAELKVIYNHLKDVTGNFTRKKTRFNCARVKRLIVEDPTVYPEDVYRYFPLLSI